MSTPTSASSSSSKRAKRTHRDSTESRDTEVMESPTKKKMKLCIICGKGASKNVVKNGNYDGMLNLYWATLGIDVKLESCNKSDLCDKCFEKVSNYYEINDIIVYFETYFKSLRLELLKKAIEGADNWEKSGESLTRIHKEIREKYKSHRDADYQDPEDEQIKQTLQTYKMELTTKDGEAARKIKLSKKDEDDEKVDGKTNGKKPGTKASSAKSSNANSSESEDSN